MKVSVALMVVIALCGSAVLFAGEQPKVPEELSKVFNYYVGEWTVEGKIGDTPFKGRASFQMPPGKHCIVGTVSFGVDGKPMHISLVSGWDSSTGWYTEQGIGSDGGVYALKWRKVSETMDEGELVGTLGGKKMTEKDRLERKGENEFVVTCTERREGDESPPDWTFIYHRVLGEKKEKTGK